MAVYRLIHVSFWQDAFVLDLTPEEKYFYIYLMTNSKTSQCGIYELPKRIIETDTGYNRETVEKLLKRFIEYGKIQYCDATKELFLLNWIRHNATNSPKVKSCIKKELEKVKNKEFVHMFYTLCIRYGYSIDMVSIDYGEKEKEKEKEKENTLCPGLDDEGDKKSSSPKSKTYDDDSPYMNMAKYLQKRILEWKPDNVFRGNLNKWADTFRLIHERDKRSKEDIKVVIDWATADSFWQANILSPDKLRKQFDTLQAQMKRTKLKSNDQIQQKNKQNKFDREVQLNRWIENGGDPDEFVYKPES